MSPTTRAAVAQGVERGHACAHERAGFREGEVIRNQRQSRRARDHVLGVAAVRRDAGNLARDAREELTAAAGLAFAAIAPVPADADALALFPVVDAVAERIDHADDFVSRDTRVLDRHHAFLDNRIAVADPAGLHLDAYRAATGFRNVALDELERTSRLSYLDRAHFLGHSSSPEIRFLVAWASQMAGPLNGPHSLPASGTRVHPRGTRRSRKSRAQRAPECANSRRVRAGDVRECSSTA